MLKPAFSDKTHIPCVAAGGRGLKDEAGLSLLLLFAELSGAEVAATRGAVESGLLPADRMIGMSGKRIYTELYLSFGVSGSNFHTAGIKGAPYIFAVDTDPKARIFELADMGVCGDAKAVLEKLITCMKQHPGNFADMDREEQIRLLRDAIQ